jgi:hypothetical protein
MRLGRVLAPEDRGLCTVDVADGEPVAYGAADASLHDGGLAR